MGVLGWAPSEFWAAFPHDLYPAIDGWMRANTTNKDGAAPETGFITEDEVFELMQRFPDEKA